MFHYKYQWKLGALCQRFKPYPDKVIGPEVKEIMPSKNTSISIFFILKSYSFSVPVSTAESHKTISDLTWRFDKLLCPDFRLGYRSR